MSDAKSENHLPKAEGQHADIFYGSPMAIVGMFVEVVRARFKADAAEALPWRWRDDPTPDVDENNVPHANGGVPRTLYIESAFVDDPEARNYRPAILVDKGDTQLTKPVLGNRSGYIRHDGTETFYAPARIPIEIQCISEKRGESSQLADFTWFHVAACQALIRQEFRVHDISPPVAGKTEPFRRNEGNKEAWMTPISFDVMVEYRWKTRPIAPVLQSVMHTLRVRGDGDPTTGAIVTATLISAKQLPR